MKSYKEIRHGLLSEAANRPFAGILLQILIMFSMAR